MLRKSLKTGFSGLRQTNKTYPYPWDTRCKEWIAESPLTSKTTWMIIFPYFLLELILLDLIAISRHPDV
jgi:hypothetical protein